MIITIYFINKHTFTAFVKEPQTSFQQFFQTSQFGLHRLAVPKLSFRSAHPYCVRLPNLSGRSSLPRSPSRQTGYPQFNLCFALSLGVSPYWHMSTARPSLQRFPRTFRPVYHNILAENSSFRPSFLVVLWHSLRVAYRAEVPTLCSNTPPGSPVV